MTGGNKKNQGINMEIQNMMKRKTILRKFIMNNMCLRGKERAKKELAHVENFLVENCAEKNAAIIKDHLNQMENNEGNFNQLKLWKLKKKICPPKTDPPMGKKDEKGAFITAPNLLKNLYLKTYEKRLENRPMKKNLMDIFFLKEKLWSCRLENLKTKETEPWKHYELEKALKNLKNNKTADPHGLINELFKNSCAGSNLFDSLLLLFNGIKENFFIPKFFLLQNITTVFKNKGSRFEFENERGIFILTVFKKVLDKLIYQDNFKVIDNNMTDSNIGARRQRNIKNHLFIIYGIINNVLKDKVECVDIQIYDLQKAFDALWLKECMNDLHDTLEEENRNEKIALLYESNKNNLVAVKTAVGMTDRKNIPDLVQQGGTWGPVLCSNTVDTIGKKCRDRGEMHYLYKNTTRVLPLAMIDDINGISKCGIDSISLNTFINTQIELKKLKFHVPDHRGRTKCHKMHIGPKKGTCPILKVHNTVMEEVTEDTYLGDIISSDGKNTKNIESRISKGIGKITEIIHLLEMISLGEHYMEIAILFRETIFLNGILTNAEIWYSFTEAEIKEFENLDKKLLRKILQVPISTPQEALYLELGILPIGVIVKARRINYLHYLVHRNKSEMLYSFFITQWNNPSRGDWTETVKADLADFNIPCNFEFLRSKSQEAFKRLVKVKSREFALNQLTHMQRSHSKMDEHYYQEIAPQKYISLKGARIEHIRNIFRFRTKMARFGENYKSNNDQTQAPCPLCFNHLDSQSLSFQCEFFKDKLRISCNMNDLNKDDISLDTAITITKMMELREKQLEENKNKATRPMCTGLQPLGCNTGAVRKITVH